MWEEDDEDEDIIIPGTPRANSLIESFSDWERGISRYFGEAELEFLFRHFQYYAPESEYKVRKILEMGLDMFPNSGVFQICQARYFMDKGLLDEAIESLRNAKLLDPSNPEIAVLLSECLEEKEEYKQALEILLEAEENSADFNQDIQVRLASLLFHFERRNEAIEKVASIIKEECNNNEITGSVATFTFDTEDVLKATDLLINEDPFNASYWFFKGHNALFVEQYEIAIPSFEYAHYLDEKAPEPLFFLGVCHKEKKEYHLAKKYFGEASEAGYSKEECVIETAICMNRTDDFVQARFLLQNLVPESEENKSEIYYELGFSYLGEFNPLKALPYLEKSVALNPGLHTYVLIGEVYVQLCETDNLIETYQTAKEFRLMDAEFFTTHFFSMFYREEVFDYMEEIIEMDRQENNTEFPSVLQMVMNALLLKAQGKTVRYQECLIDCFSQSIEETTRYIEKIDPVLLTDRDVISIKELF